MMTSNIDDDKLASFRSSVVGNLSWVSLSSFTVQMKPNGALLQVRGILSRMNDLASIVRYNLPNRSRALSFFAYNFSEK